MDISDTECNVLIDIYNAYKENRKIWYARQYNIDGNVHQEIFTPIITDITDFLNQIKQFTYLDIFHSSDFRTMYAVKTAIDNGNKIINVYQFGYKDSLIQICTE